MNYSESIYYSILPFVIMIEAVAVLVTYFAITWSKRMKTKETLSRLHDSFIGIFMIEFWYWFTSPLLKLCMLLKLTPNKVTGISLFLSFITGAIYATGHLSIAGWMLGLSGSLDMIDGRLARATGKSSKGGAFFDSCSDRYSDAFIFIGLGIYFLSKSFSPEQSAFTISMPDYMSIIIIMTIMLGTASMSYVKARGEVVGAHTKRGLMQRPERIMMIGFYSVLDPFVRIILSNYGINTDAGLIIILIIMTVLINISAIVRMTDLFSIINKMKND